MPQADRITPIFSYHDTRTDGRVWRSLVRTSCAGHPQAARAVRAKRRPWVPRRFLARRRGTPARRTSRRDRFTCSSGRRSTFCGPSPSANRNVSGDWLDAPDEPPGDADRNAAYRAWLTDRYGVTVLNDVGEIMGKSRTLLPKLRTTRSGAECRRYRGRNAELDRADGSLD